MAVELVFTGTENSATDLYYLQLFVNSDKELCVTIRDEDSEELRQMSICLDKSTAIKFSKEIRKQIALIL